MFLGLDRVILSEERIDGNQLGWCITRRRISFRPKRLFDAPFPLMIP
jgi:hypothetical protein